MQSYERDYFLYRIINEYMKFEKNKTQLKIIAPNIEVMYEASDIYRKIYSKCKNDEVLDDKQLYQFLLNMGVWNDEEEKRLTKDIPEYLDNCKVELFHNYMDTAKCKKIKKFMDRVIQEQNKIYGIRHGYDFLTCEGTATFAKMNYIVEQTTLFNGKKYGFTKVHQHQVMEFIYENYISEAIVRELARTEPWLGMWKLSRKNQLFDKSSVEVSEDKKRLVAWSFLYDSVQEAPDCPSDTVINEDDFLDGWLILKRREIDKQRKENYLEKKIGKNANAGEVFVLTNSKEEAKELYDMNSPEAKAVVNSRLKYINTHGVVDDKNLPDVKQQVMMEMNRKAMSRGKG